MGIHRVQRAQGPQGQQDGQGRAGPRLHALRGGLVRRRGKDEGAVHGLGENRVLREPDFLQGRRAVRQVLGTVFYDDTVVQHSARVFGDGQVLLGADRDRRREAVDFGGRRGLVDCRYYFAYHE